MRKQMRALMIAFLALSLHRYAVDGVAEETEIGFTGKSNPYTIPLQKTLT